MHTRTSLRQDLTRLGVRPGDLLMVHAGLRSVGRIVGGVNVLVQALCDAIGEAGTVTAYVDWEPCYAEEDDPAAIPVFDKRLAHAARDHGILHETLRTWPGALRSDHPDAGVVAIGPLAAWIVDPHPFQYGYGAGTPFARIVEAQGRVLMMGAPLDTITLLHHAEDQADLPDKRVLRYRRLMPGPQWVEFEEFETGDPVAPYLPENCFELIAQDALAAGNGRTGKVGSAVAYLFEGPALVRYGKAWLEERGRQQ